MITYIFGSIFFFFTNKFYLIYYLRKHVSKVTKFSMNPLTSNSLSENNFYLVIQVGFGIMH